MRGLPEHGRVVLALIDDGTWGKKRPVCGSMLENGVEFSTLDASRSYHFSTIKDWRYLKILPRYSTGCYSQYDFEFDNWNDEEEE